MNKMNLDTFFLFFY